MNESREPPPRILIVSGEQWPRALLRAQLIEAGYDAVGAPDLATATLYPAAEPERGPVRLVVLDQEAVEGANPAYPDRLRAKHPDSRFVLLARGTVEPPPGEWVRVLRRPLSIEDAVACVSELVPLPGS